VGGERLVSPGWVDYSAAPTPGSEHYGYGAGFWTNRGDGEGQRYRIAHGVPRDAFMARGTAGQYIIIVPSQKLVVARFGSAFTPRDDMDVVARLVAELIATLPRAGYMCGVAWSPDGRLYGGQHDRKRLVAFSNDGTESVIAEGVQTHHLTVTSRNEIYFCQGPAHKVWMLDTAGRKRVVYDRLNWPRSVQASADRSLLVVNDPGTRWVWAFQILADGSLTNARPFYRLETGGESSAPDPGGMAFDSEGLLYVATKLGIQVCDRLGQVIAIIDVPGSDGAASVFFGGPGLQWLYVTEWDKIYRRPVNRPGAARR